MNSRVVIILLLLFPFNAMCQLKGVVRDSSSKSGIPYTNIWVEHKNVGTTADEEGNFKLPKISNGKVLVFNATGYETRRISLDSTVSTVYLTPKHLILSEVVVSPKRSTRTQSIGKYERSKINFYFGSGSSPWAVARFFPYKKEYSQSEFLQQIKLLTSSDVKDALFNVRLYMVGADGAPADYLYDQNIIGVAKKGKRSTEIDVADLNIRFPDKGFFVAIEWLIIDRNRHEYKTDKRVESSLIGSKMTSNTRVSYQPLMGTVASDTDENSWIMTKGKWSKVFPSKSGNKRYRDKYNLLAIELTLTN